MSKTFDTLGNDTVDVLFDHLGFRRTVTVGGVRAAFSGIMQIVTSSVRISANALSSRVSREVSGRTGSWASTWVSLADFSNLI